MKQVYQKSERIPADAKGVFENLNTEQKLALVTSGSLPPGIGGFLLDVIDGDTVELSSDVTDHYVERNTTIQDHVALRPETVTLHGVVSELSLLRTPAANPYDARRNSLPPREDLAPELTEGATQTKKADTTPAAKGVSVLKKYEDAYGAIGAAAGKRQKDVFSYLYQIWKGRQFVTVETAWGIWPNMVIQTLRAEQGKDSRFQSEFYVTFKAVRFASDITIATVPMEKPAADQAAKDSPNGQGGAKDAPVRDSLLRKLATGDWGK